MNRNPWTAPQHRFSFAAVALLASTAVLSSVLWLFASDDVPTAGAPAAIARQAPASPSAQPVAGRLAANPAQGSRL